IAYLCHDYDDGISAGMIKQTALPQHVADVLGTNPSSMITVMVSDIIINSEGKNEIIMSPAVKEAMDEFRLFMFEHVYHSPHLDADRQKAQYVVTKLFEYFIAHPGDLPQQFLDREEKWGVKITVADYIAGLTDLYAVKLFEKLFVPSTWGLTR
ncbi:MAG: deoxyguanosinetriphosphate triphosphohydrolase, partial [Sporomusaceae bacterium]|nr:deoxyguanosinetriphosphate triphosphohydrolase [Sporomusaceae bacterium]